MTPTASQNRMASMRSGYSKLRASGWGHPSGDSQLRQNPFRGYPTWVSPLGCPHLGVPTWVSPLGCPQKVGKPLLTLGRGGKQREKALCPFVLRILLQHAGQHGSCRARLL